MNDLAAQTIQVVNKSDDLVASAIQTANKSIAVYCRYIRPNDVGTTGSHQSGFYIQKHFSDDLFDVVCQKGTNKTISIKINWQDGSVTNSNFKYYGQGTRNEARITGFGKNFEFLSDKYSGSLLVLCRACYKDLLFHAFVLSSDEDIEIFIAETNILPGSLYLPKKTRSRG
ncbi:TPA: EcoRII N-terminal effector-binding domain-containing protein [Neisseria meningitidis]